MRKVFSLAVVALLISLPMTSVCTNGSDTCYTDGATCGPLNPM
jgi:hypothetical protein